MMHDILKEICTAKLAHIRNRQALMPLEDVKKQALLAPPPRPFISALKEKDNSGDIALIAEIKKASPSKGLIRPDFHPVEIAKCYQGAGAACLSILTDEPYFKGHDTFLTQVKEACPLPVLRKDFMLEPYQIYESRALGADCILLIAAALDDPKMHHLYDLSKELGMDVLIEVHNSEELERALALHPEMVGVNNRNLKTLEINLETSHILLKNIPKNIFKVAESGIYTHEDIISLKHSGANAYLIGESLMRQDNIDSATKKILGKP